MAAALVQHLGEVDRNGTGSTSTVITMTKTLTAGNTVIVGIVAYDGTGASPTCADNLGNTYTLVERSDGTYDTALFSAPVTNAGSLTSITITTASTRYVAAEAAEFSGVGALSSVGAGTATGSGATQNPINNKTIPADGLAVGFTGGNVNDTYSAGAASGTPSTTPTLIDAHASGNMSAALLYALGGSGVTGFTMNVTTAGSGTFSNAGGLFDPSGPVQSLRPDADTADGGWTSTPLWSKVDEESADGTVITATAA